jgi:hypothetical protein
LFPNKAVLQCSNHERLPAGCQRLVTQMPVSSVLALNH